MAWCHQATSHYLKKKNQAITCMSQCMVPLVHNVLTHWGLTHWGWVTHICVNNLTNIGSDNGLSPGRRQAIIWTNAGILLIGPLGTNSNEIVIKIYTFSFKNIHLKMSSGKWWPFCLGLNVLMTSFGKAWLCQHQFCRLFSTKPLPEPTTQMDYC